MPALLKIAISATLIWLVNEVVVRHSKPLLGSMIASLPLVSLLTFIWIHHDLKSNPTEEISRLSSHSAGVFWFVLPSLPMFLVFPALLRKGLGFWPALGLCCVLTAVLYLATSELLKRIG